MHQLATLSLAIFVSLFETQTILDCWEPGQSLFQPALLHPFHYELMKMAKKVKANPLLLQDVGQSILESYSRVMESLAFNIMARIDDLLYIDDATKFRAVAEPISLFKQDGYGDGCPLRRQILPSPFSIQNTSYVSQITAPASYSSAIKENRDGNPIDRN